MSETIVLGAGMVGVGTALALQDRGQKVVLIDRRDPGEETSYGNVGIIQTEAAEPVAMPRSLSRLLGIALGRTNDVVWNLASLPEYLRPLAAYFWYSSPGRHRRQAQVYHQLTRRAFDDHLPLIQNSGAGDLIREGGFRVAFRSGHPLDEEVRRAEHITREYGIPHIALDGPMLARAEPNLRVVMAGAVQWHESRTCLNPGGLVKAYASLFEARGGTIVKGDGTTLRQRGTGWVVEAEAGPVEADSAVVALGPWSQGVAARFGYAVPMLRKRGYHWHLKPVAGPSISMLDAERGAFIAVMQAGVRIATGAELTAFNAPANPRQIDKAIVAARELFELGDPVETRPWFGSRPCLPDMLPLVGRAPRHPGLWFNFGHGHQGFTLGPTTGILLADMMVGGPVPDYVTRLGYRW